MTAGSAVHPSGLVEVMTVHQDCPDRDPVGIGRLFDLARREEEAIRRLDGCVADLHEVQAAKKALAAGTPAQLRVALTVGHRGLGEAAGR